ncbi:MAG: hypothetical protein ACTSRZ_20375 [Promethearchaeota archaeon]
MKMRCGKTLRLYQGYFWDNPIIEISELREDINRENKVKIIEKVSKSNYIKNQKTSKGKHIDLLI